MSRMSGVKILNPNGKPSWNYLITDQKLSDEFLLANAGEILSEKIGIDNILLRWNVLLTYQQLSEQFIRENMINGKFDVLNAESDEPIWKVLFKNQQLSEQFICEIVSHIENWNNEEDWDYIAKYQKLSPQFIEEKGIYICKDNWLYKSNDEKMDYIRKNTNFIINNDDKGDFIVAFKACREDYTNYRDNLTNYAKDKEYSTWRCDHNPSNEMSYGLHVADKKAVLDYFCKHSGILMLVKVYVEDIGCFIKDNKVIRCQKFTKVCDYDRF